MHAEYYLDVRPIVRSTEIAFPLICPWICLVP